MITTSPINDLAATLAQKVNAGSAARETFGDKSVAFQWADGLPAVLARFVESAKVDGLTFAAVRVRPSATPAGKVAERAVKPSAVTLESEQVTLSKYGGLATFSLEQVLTTAALLPAINATIVQQSLVAYDADCLAALAADHGSTATGASWPEAILNGVAEVASNGSNPTLLVLSPADYAAAVIDPASTFSSDLSSGQTALFGLQLAVVIGATTGTAYVMDSRAAVALENVNSPLFVLDPYSMADTNEARLVSELVAGFYVTQPAGVCQITVTPTP